MNKANNQDKCVWKKAPVEKDVMCLMRGDTEMCALWKHNDYWLMRLYCFKDCIKRLEGEYNSLEEAEEAVVDYIYNEYSKRVEHDLSVMGSLLDNSIAPLF